MEGGIAVGKSSLLEYLEKTSSINTTPEPIEQWINNQSGINMLNDFYSNINNAFVFQMWILYTLKNRKLPNSKLRVIERLYGNSIFTRVLSHHLSKVEEYVLGHYERDYIMNLPKIHLIIFLRCNSEENLKRIKKRGRPEEKNISLNYLEKINNAHDLLFLDKEFLKLINTFVWVVDCNKDMNAMEHIYKKISNDLVTFVEHKDTYQTITYY